MNNKEIVVLFSGGTDSTLAAALMVQKYDKVHLVTYDRFGFANIRNSQLNVDKLRNKFGYDKFIHKFIRYDNLSKFVFYERYIQNVFKHGFFLLSTCGLCKLAMHMRTIKYCLDNNVGNVCDGANKGMHLFPAQMKNVIKNVYVMYASFNINYTNPVFGFEGLQDTGFADRLRLERIMPSEDVGQIEEKEILPQKEIQEQQERKEKKTTGCRLCQMGLMPTENVKGTDLDRKMQPRCFQFILFNIFVKWYYLYDHSYEEYEQATVNFYNDKITNLIKVLVDYQKNTENSKYAKLFTR